MVSPEYLIAVDAKSLGGDGAFLRTGLWHHLVSVGICARLIATRVQLADFEDVFLAGLLHDIGIILEDQHLHKGFSRVVHSVAEGTTLIQREREVLGLERERH